MIIINNKNSGDDDAAPLLPHPIGIDRDSGVPVISFSFEVRLALPQPHLQQPSESHPQASYSCCCFIAVDVVDVAARAAGAAARRRS